MVSWACHLKTTREKGAASSNNCNNDNDNVISSSNNTLNDGQNKNDSPLLSPLPTPPPPSLTAAVEPSASAVEASAVSFCFDGVLPLLPPPFLASLRSLSAKKKKKIQMEQITMDLPTDPRIPPIAPKKRRIRTSRRSGQKKREIERTNRIIAGVWQ